MSPGTSRSRRIGSGSVACALSLGDLSCTASGGSVTLPAGESVIMLLGAANRDPVHYPDPDKLDVAELKQRLLAIQALETARCVEEGVVTDMREADVGSVLGFGFAPFAGGTISYIDGMGTPTFVALCRDFAKRHGARFAPGKLLVDMAKKGDTFYGRFPPLAPKAAA